MTNIRDVGVEDPVGREHVLGRHAQGRCIVEGITVTQLGNDGIGESPYTVSVNTRNKMGFMMLALLAMAVFSSVHDVCLPLNDKSILTIESLLVTLIRMITV